MKRDFLNELKAICNRVADKPKTEGLTIHRAAVRFNVLINYKPVMFNLTRLEAQFWTDKLAERPINSEKFLSFRPVSQVCHK